MKQLQPNEYSAYYGNYIFLNLTENLIENLENQLLETSQFFSSLPADILEFQYEIGKWTPKDILQHIIDAERVFAYRALRFARLDTTNLQGYEENDYAQKAFANNRTMENLLEEYKCVKKATICLFKSFTEKMLLQIGMANNATISVRAIGFVISGHEIHHINTIKSRYIRK